MIDDGEQLDALGVQDFLGFRDRLIDSMPGGNDDCPVISLGLID